MGQNGIDQNRVKVGARCALTIVELVGVVAVISVIVGLLMPAIQQARESAHRCHCQSNLRQIGIGLCHHHIVHLELPIGCLDWRTYTNGDERQLAWSAFLLPFVGHNLLHDRLDFNFAFDSYRNAKAASENVPLYRCPSARDDTLIFSERGRIDYGGIFGERIASPNNPPKGTMLIDKAITFKEIHDGLSNTLIVGEDAGWSEGEWINGRNIFDQAFPINSAPAYENDLRSQHSSGVNTLFADGHVSFLNNETDILVLAAICSRSGGEQNHIP